MLVPDHKLVITGLIPFVYKADLCKVNAKKRLLLESYEQLL